jgi:hypothetical protein
VRGVVKKLISFRLCGLPAPVLFTCAHAQSRTCQYMDLSMQ